MAKKRKSDGMDASPATKARRSGPALTSDYHQFCRDADIEPVKTDNGLISPSSKDPDNIKQKVMNCYSFLWWDHKRELDRVIRSFLQRHQASPIQNRLTRTSNLCWELEQVASLYRTPGGRSRSPTKKRDAEREAQRMDEQDAEPSPPGSPTSSIKRFFPTTKGRAERTSPKKAAETVFTNPNPPVSGFSSLPSSQRHKSAKMAVAASANTSFSAPAGANTSFSTTGTTSFNKDSFWSEAQPAGSQNTPMSSFESVVPPPPPPQSKQSSVFSSMTPSVAQEAIATTERVEQRHNDNETSPSYKGSGRARTKRRTSHTTRSRGTATSTNHESSHQFTFQSQRESTSTDYGSVHSSEMARVVDEAVRSFTANPQRETALTNDDLSAPQTFREGEPQPKKNDGKKIRKQESGTSRIASTIHHQLSEARHPRIVGDIVRDSSRPGSRSSKTTVLRDHGTSHEKADQIPSSSQNSNSTDRTVRPAPFPTSVRSPRESQSTDYGSIDSAEMARVEAMAQPRHHVDAAVTKSIVDGVHAPPSYASVPLEPAPIITALRSRQQMQPAMRFVPTTGFAQLRIPNSYSTLPFVVQWEAHRVLQTGKISMEELETRWRGTTLQSLYNVASELDVPFKPAFSPDKNPTFDEVTMNGVLQFSKASSGAVFDLILHPPKADKSCDLQRRFGADRVLYLDIPPFAKPPDAHKGRDILARFREMATSPQLFLGHRWILYVLQPNKRNKKSSKAGPPKGCNRLVLLAVDGLKTRDIFHYVLPYRTNAEQPARKLYTRLDLLMSRTTSALQFEDVDVDFMAKDQLATEDGDDTRFQDMTIEDDAVGKFDPQNRKEMSDGCAELSYWSYWQIAKALDKAGRSAFQCRIGGAKGVWYRAPYDYDSTEAKPPGPHIKLTESQVKVKRKALIGCDPGCLSLNVVKANSFACPSVLHIGFLPILLDRGVPTDAILEVVTDQAEAEVQEFEEALEGGPAPLRAWMSTHNQKFEERQRINGIQTLAGSPVSREEKIIMLLESGFDPRTCPPLARDVKAMAQQVFELKGRSYKIHLDRSTTLMGMADPTGLLKPGEVCINFSSPFEAASNEAWSRLHDMELLVARNPAMAPWDIQKVRAVSRPELDHITDMIIFSVKGPRPLASLLQGGDYDGDTFWVCFEPKLVRGFKNHPAPWTPPPPEHFGIVQKMERLSEFIRNPESEQEWCKWLGEMAIARLDPNLLGVVTNLHERVVYATGSIRSEQTLALVHLHDYLVDADKQGYVFTNDNLQEFKKAFKIPDKLPFPHYWRFTKPPNEEPQDNKENRAPPVVGNIIDAVYFDVVEPIINSSLKRVEQLLGAANTPHPDPDLVRFYEQTSESTSVKNDSILREELRDLVRDLLATKHLWSREFTIHLNSKTPKERTEIITMVRARYDAAQPRNTTHPVVIEWLRRQGHDATIWEKLKASALAKFQHKAENPGAFIFAIAAKELCALKAHELGETRLLCMSQYAMLKLRKVKKILEASDDFDEDLQDEVEDDVEEAGKPTETLQNAEYF